MPKSRFTSSDVRAIVRDLRVKGVLGMRVVNVYDLDSKTYLIKLATPGVAEKVVLLIESGIRFHSTKFDRDKSDMPSGFSVKLRKHIRAKRLEDISQLGVDRVVDFRFGSGENCNHVILELYAAGNIVLTDHKYEILALLRTHKFEENVLSAVRELYPIDHATTLTTEEGGGAGAGDSSLSISLQTSTPEDLLAWIRRECTAGELSKATSAAAAAAGGGGGSGKAKKATLKLLLTGRGSGVAQYGTEIITHCVLLAGLEPNRKLSCGGKKGAGGVATAEQLLSLEECTQLLLSMKEASRVYAGLDAPGQKGYILTSGGENLVTLDDGSKVARYEDVLPHLLQQHKPAAAAPPLELAAGNSNNKDAAAAVTVDVGGGLSEHRPDIVEFASFDDAVDKYFAKLEEHKLAQAADSAESAIKNKVLKIRDDQRARLAALEGAEALAMRRAQLLEKRADDVDKVITVLRSAVSSGVGWDELTDYVAAQQDLGNPIAMMVHALRLETSTVVVVLEDDEAAESAPSVAVDIDITKSAHSNAREMFAAMKVAQIKKEKTAEASERVVSVAERQSADQLKQHYSKRELKAVRKAYWFEKFAWFVTSENYLCVAGRDAQQNDLLVKKYLKAGDAYVHADVHGAASCVLLNKDPKGLRELSPVALFEAGCMTVGRSSAWKSKMIANAWWVHAHQVSKTAPTGEYLTTGSFMIRGKKNFLPPSPLEMGLALLFKLNDESLALHVDERRDKATAEDEEEEVSGVGVKQTSNEAAGKDRGKKKGVDGAQQTATAEKFVKQTKQDRRAIRAAAEGEEEVGVVAAAAAAAAAPDAVFAAPPPSLIAVNNAAVDDAENSAEITPGKSSDDGAVGDDKEEEEEQGSGDDKDGSGRGGGAAASSSLESTPELPTLTTASSDSSGAGGDIGGGSGGFVTPRERKLLKKRPGLSLEALRAEEALKQRKKKEEQREQALAAAEAAAAAEIAAAAAAELECLKSNSDGNGGSGGGGEIGSGAGCANSSGGEAGKEAKSKSKKKKGEGEKTEAPPPPPPPPPPSSVAEVAEVSSGERATARTAMLRGKKGKAKRVKAKYRDADDDDLEVHKVAVGHSALDLHGLDDDDHDEGGADGGDGGKGVENTEKNGKGHRVRTQETISKVLRGDVTEAMNALSSEASATLQRLCEEPAEPGPEGKPEGGKEGRGLPGLNPGPLLKLPGDLDVFDLRMLGGLGPDSQCEALRCFERADLRKIANKSGLLAGIMRRLLADSEKMTKKKADGEMQQRQQEEESKGCEESSAAGGAAAASADGEVDRGERGDNDDTDVVAAEARTADDDGGGDGDGGPVLVEKGRAAKRKMEADLKKLLEEEGGGGAGESSGGGGGLFGEESGSYVLELNKLTGSPLPTDGLLFAVPVCAPFAALSKYKYRVKLTPGEGKKGRTGKQALEIFARMKECTPREKDLIKMVSDNEVVQTIIGDVKMSTPGLNAVHAAKRSAKKAGKNKPPSS